MNVEVCRLCAEPASNNVELSSLVEDQRLLQIIETHIFIKIDSNDHLPHNICNVCKETVNAWHDFWSGCHRVQKSFPSDLSNSSGFSKILNQQTGAIRRTSKEQRSRYCYCIAEWCNNNNATCPMFRVPSDKARGDQWLINSGRKDLLNLDGNKRKLYLCKEHFSDDMFSNCKKEKLNWNAVPSIFSQPPASQQLSQNNLASILQREMNTVSIINGKLVRLLPKNSDGSKSDSTLLTESKATEDCGLNNFIKIGLCRIPSVKDETVSSKEHASSPPVFCESTVESKRSCELVCGDSPGRKAVNAVSTKHSPLNAASKKVTNQPSSSGQLEEEPSMTCDDTCFPPTSHLVFPESMHTCTFCGEVFAIKNSLSNHLKTYHS